MQGCLQNSVPSSSPLFRVWGACRILQAKPAGKSFQHEDWQSNTLALNAEKGLMQEEVYTEKPALRGNPNEKDRKRRMIGLDWERSRHPLAGWWFIWFILAFLASLEGKARVHSSCLTHFSCPVPSAPWWGGELKRGARCRTPSGLSMRPKKQAKMFLRLTDLHLQMDVYDYAC